MKRKHTLLLAAASTIVVSCSNHIGQKTKSPVMSGHANTNKAIAAESSGAGLEYIEITICDSVPENSPPVRSKNGIPEGYTYWGLVDSKLRFNDIYNEITKKLDKECIQLHIQNVPEGKKVYYKDCD